MADPAFLATLKDPALFREACLIDGHWLPVSETGAKITVLNPATGQLLGRVPSLRVEETRLAIAAAQKAFPAWRALPATERASLLKRLYALMMENQEDLARIITAEQGKPLAESRGEIAYAASFIEWFAEEARRVSGDVLPGTRQGQRILVMKEPVGVFATITPWNFPSAMITRKAGAGWAAGCTGVMRPADETPFSALALGVLAERAGFPAGVCNILTGAGPVIGGELTSSPVVRKLSFTGSTQVGALLMAQCAPTLKKLSLELGGNAPLIVLDDADVELAVQGAMFAKFRNAGQTCVCANRILVQEGIYEQFSTRFVEEVRKLKMGAGFNEGVTIAPLIHDKAVVKAQVHVQDALAQGAKLLTGGTAEGPTFYQPTVLGNVPKSALIFREETFGPVAPLFRFSTEEEAVALANDTPFGLAAYLYSRDVGKLLRLSEQLDYGMIGLNESAISTASAPFGGVKASGLGREGGSMGIEEYLEVKYLCLGGL